MRAAAIGALFTAALGMAACATYYDDYGRDGHGRGQGGYGGYDEINEFEAQQSYDGTAIVKLFFHITQETQDQRLAARLEHPWKRWKVTAEDFRNRSRRGEYLAAIGEMLERTDTRWAPWTVIDGNNKKAARIAALTAVAEALEAACPPKPPAADPEVQALARAALWKDG